MFGTGTRVGHKTLRQMGVRIPHGKRQAAGGVGKGKGGEGEVAPPFLKFLDPPLREEGHELPAAPPSPLIAKLYQM